MRPAAGVIGAGTAIAGAVLYAKADNCSTRDLDVVEGIGCGIEWGFGSLLGGALIAVGAALVIAAAVSPGEPDPPASAITPMPQASHEPGPNTFATRPKIRLGFD